MIENIKNNFSLKYHQKKGMKYLSQGLYKKAILNFEKALLLDDSIENYFYFSVCLIALNRHIEAIGYLEKIIDLQADNILVSATLIECYLVVREWEKADRLVNYLKNNNNTNQYIKDLITLVDDPVLREKYATAKESFFKAIDFYDNKDFESAFQSIKLAIDLDEQNAAYYFFAGTILIHILKRNKKSPDSSGMTFTKDKLEQTRQEMLLLFEKSVLLAPQNEGYKKHLQYVKTRYKG
ncbi:MAG: CDC27 family protein [Candidatus Cloacimonetes bacterium]|nr:CDC27 family protein [Candidatus Cloacimonadota bacterium]